MPRDVDRGGHVLEATVDFADAVPRGIALRRHRRIDGPEVWRPVVREVVASAVLVEI